VWNCLLNDCIISKTEVVNGEVEKKIVKLQPCPDTAGGATQLGLRAPADLAQPHQGESFLPAVHPHDQSGYKAAETVTAFKRREGNPPCNPPVKLLHPTVLAKAISVPPASLQLT